MMRNGDVTTWMQITLTDVPRAGTLVSLKMRTDAGDDGYDPIGDIIADNVEIEAHEYTVFVLASVGNRVAFLTCDEVRDCRGLSGPDELRNAPWIYSGDWQEVLDEKPDEIDEWFAEQEREIARRQGGEE